MTTSFGASHIPINDLKRIVDPRLLEVAHRALSSGWWLNGHLTDMFCKSFASYVGVDHCLGVANGTDALEISMRALVDVRERVGSEVITVANAGGYSTIACRLLGMTPVYADTEESSQLASLESVVSAIGNETALVIVTHLYGGVVDVPRLRSMMDSAGHSEVPILEDCAQAHGVRLGHRMAGSMGDLATFSFYPTKNLGAFGDGGAITSSDAELIERCRMLHQYGWTKKYTIDIPHGRNSRLDEVQAAILSNLLTGLDAANARRVQILDRYVAASSRGLRVVRSPNGTVAHLAVVLCDRRDDLQRHFADRAIQSDIHYPILDCDQPGWREMSKRIAPGGLAVSSASVGRLLTLPCFPTMRDDEIERVCDAIRAWDA